MFGSSSAVVRRLRVRGRVEDAAARRAQRALAAADVRPASLPAHAILCIRRLGDPKPGRVKADGRAIRPPGDWEDAARAAVAQLASAAARPARGPVPASADAVLFADRAELLACLARDWCDDLFHSSWWWRALLGSHDAAETVLRAFRETPEAAPAAFDILARADRLAPFLARLSPGAAETIAFAIASVAGIDAAHLFAAADAVARHSSRAVAASARCDQASIEAMHSDVDPHLTRDLTALAPEVAMLRAGRAARAVAIAGLLIHRAPHLASRVLRSVAAHATELQSRGEYEEVEPVGREPGSQAPVDTSETASMLIVESTELETPLKSAGMPAPTTASEAEASTPRSLPIAEPFEPRPDEPAIVAYTPETMETGLGGAFYLINVATALGLYADFTAPRGRNLSVPLWDFLAVSAEVLAGQGFKGDALYAVLGRLAGRPAHERPGPQIRRSVRRRMPVVRRRIAEALRVHEAVAGPLLVTAAATLVLAPATIEVRFTLADLPIEIRLAGLDRDPGFVPAAGRTVVFRYV